MPTRLFIGNLPRQVSDAELEGIFAEFGTVQSVEIMRNKETGEGKGFGYVEMGSDAEAQAAIQGMQEREVEGRKLTVDAAKPRKYRAGGGFNDTGFGGGYGGGGGYRGGGGRGRY
jgi:RNA recognition motif-containing protein